MTPEQERSISAQERVVDGIFQKMFRYNGLVYTEYNAEEMTRLVHTNCLAAIAPDSPIIRRFVEECKHYLKQDFTTMDIRDIKVAVDQLFSRLDEMFFFGILSRRVTIAEGIDTSTTLVRLNVLDTQNPYYDQPGYEFPSAFHASQNLVSWPQPATIMIFLQLPNRRTRFEDILSALIYGTTKAFLNLSDPRHPKHQDWLRKGTMLQWLDTFISKSLGDMTPEIKETMAWGLYSTGKYINNYKIRNGELEGVDDDEPEKCKPRGWKKFWKLH
ncbi:hypothetical protein F5Y08DRAFT_339063 [Xylaria arbuscula]|nr:hypothetical protein F5Y08DRAFT_339063 [Xylaria arbuscula]